MISEAKRYHEVVLNINELSEYEADSDNIAELLVHSGKDDISKQCKVLFSFNKEALIGFGKEAIKLAYNFTENCHLHVDPLGVSYASQTMGFFLTPESPSLVVGCRSFGNLIDNGTTRISKNIKDHEDYKNFKAKYLIDLGFDDDYLEEHNIGFNNVASIKVINDGQDISSKCNFVTLMLSKSALMGLGTELLRLAHNFNKERNYYIIPMGNENYNSKLGFYLTQKSSFLSVGCGNLKDVFYYDKGFLR